VARHLEITESTQHRWRNHYGGMKAKKAKRFKEFENEIQYLKHIVLSERRAGQVVGPPCSTQRLPALVLSDDELVLGA